MGKFKELFTKAQERRMEETGCSLEEAAEWVEQQSVGFIIDYTDMWEKIDNDEEKKPWPQIGDIYYSIGSAPSGAIILNHTYTNDGIDKNLQIMNNFFKAEEDAAFEYERLRIFHELKELSDDQPWDGIKRHYHIAYDHNDKCITISDKTYLRSMNEIYFKSYESAENAIKTIGKDKIKKYLFGINSINE